MPRLRQKVASLEEVSINRTRNGAIITFHNGTTPTTHFQLGGVAAQMTDDEIDRMPTIKVREPEEE